MNLLDGLVNNLVEGVVLDFAYGLVDFLYGFVAGPIGSIFYGVINTIASIVGL